VASAATEIKLQLLAENLHKQLQTNKIFTEDYCVTKALGGFNVGDSVKGLSYEQLFIKLLGLELVGTPGSPDDPEQEPDTPPNPEGGGDLPKDPTSEQIAANIMTRQTTIYQVNSSGELEEIPYTLKTYTKAQASQPPEKVETAFYKVEDSQGNILEVGYQHMTELKEMYYMVALPDYMRLYKNTQVQTWDELGQCWVLSQTKLTELPDDISEAFASAGLAAPAVPEGYTLWANLEDIDSGTTFRFVLI
jgi:hypothetical protein